MSLEEVAEAVRRDSGLVVGPSRRQALSDAAARVAPGLAPSALAAALAESGREATLLNRLVEELTVNETFFFRHPQDLQAIDWPALARDAASGGRTHLRVWCAACSTGEEAYTLAMLAADALGSSSPPVHVIGTDVAGSALAVAREGIYRRRSVQPLPEAMRQRWLRREGDCYEVIPQLRSLVGFERQNLVRDPPPDAAGGGFDLVLCRNTLIYFDPPTARRVVKSLERALVPRGRLLLGTADRLCVWDSPTMAPARSSMSIRPRPTPAGDPVRRLSGPRPAPPEAPSLVAALKAADEDRLDEAAAAADAVLEADPLDAAGHFVRGSVELARERPQPAVESLRRALYIDPGHALAAFKLGRAHDALAQVTAARRAYGQALRALEAIDGSNLPDDLDVADVAAACRVRLTALAPEPAEEAQA